MQPLALAIRSIGLEVCRSNSIERSSRLVSGPRINSTTSGSNSRRWPWSHRMLSGLSWSLVIRLKNSCQRISICRSATLSEALPALSVLDLPLEAGSVEMSVDDGRLAVTSKNRVVAFVESIEPAKIVPAPSSLLVGQDIYLANPSSDPVTQKPLTGQSLVRGVG